MGNLIEEIAAGLDMWAEERAEERSLTWKERHAKGVPVIMTLEEWRQCIRNIPKIENHHPARHEHSGRIEIFVEDWNSDADETVKFCNFRYKPEWLEKKKRIVCSDEPPPTQHRGGVTEW